MARPVVLVALLLVVPTGDTVHTLGYLPMSRPSDGFSTEGDVLIGAVTPFHAVLGQPQARFQQPPEQPLCPGWVDPLSLGRYGHPVTEGWGGEPS